MEKFLIEIENIPTEEESKSLYDALRGIGVVNMLYTGTKAYIYGELDSTSIDCIEYQIEARKYQFNTDRG